MKSLFAEGLEQPHVKLKQKLLALNWPFLLLITAITLIGVAALYSVAGGSLEPWASRHVVRYCLGLALLFIVALSDIHFWLRAAYPLYLVSVLMLAAVLLFGVESGGATRWLGWGEFSFQPSEIMKIALVLALARYYQWLPPSQVSWPYAVLPPLAMVAVPIVLALDQPDLGTAALFGIVGGGLLSCRRELDLFHRRPCRRHRRAAACLGAAP
jgi:rod shape determining protein RodA